MEADYTGVFIGAGLALIPTLITLAAQWFLSTRARTWQIEDSKLEEAKKIVEKNLKIIEDDLKKHYEKLNKKFIDFEKHHKESPFVYLGENEAQSLYLSNTAGSKIAAIEDAQLDDRIMEYIKESNFLINIMKAETRDDFLYDELVSRHNLLNRNLHFFYNLVLNRLDQLRIDLPYEIINKKKSKKHPEVGFGLFNRNLHE
jgi:hypothetical protein